MKSSSFNWVKPAIIAGVCIALVFAVVLSLNKSNKATPVQQNSTASNNTQPRETKRYVDNIFDTLKTDANIQYSEPTNYKGEKEKLLLDVYMPDGDSETNRPAIIWLHGGGYTNGSKDLNTFEKDLAIEFAKKGFVTLNINYRLRASLETDAIGAVRDAVEDAAAAFNWLAANSEKYGVDKTKIALGGYSAGAGTVINLCYSDSSKFGIDKKSILSAINLAGGGVYLGSVQKGDPPCITIHGTNDNTVPYSASENLTAQLNESGVYNTLYPLNGSDHDVKTYYDDITAEITKFLYKNLTGEDITVEKKQGKPHEYLKVDERLAKSKNYAVKQIDFVIDGKLDEWGGSETINLDQLKDAGASIPEKNDFFGTAMVGWNEKEPTKIYIAAKITDDIIQDKNSAKTKWFNDDCLEIAFDLSHSDKLWPITKWAVGATGKDISVLGNKKNTEYKITQQGNEYIYEIAIDFFDMDAAVPEEYSIKPNDIIGFSLSYNDGENGAREHQIGWIAGQASSRLNFGNLKFSSEKAK